jgi:hypothetical protein
VLAAGVLDLPQPGPPAQASACARQQMC